MRALIAVAAFLVVSVVSVTEGSGLFLQKSCTGSGCGACNTGSCSCEELAQGACYQQVDGASGMGWCKNNYIVLRNFFLSANCTGPFTDIDTPLQQCFPASGFAGYVEYSCDGAFSKPLRHVHHRGGRVIQLPGPKFVPHEDTFDVAKHQPHTSLHQELHRDELGSTMLKLHLGEATSHRASPKWVLRHGAGAGRPVARGASINATELLAAGLPTSLRHQDVAQGNTWILRK